MDVGMSFRLVSGPPLPPFAEAAGDRSRGIDERCYEFQ